MGFPTEFRNMFVMGTRGHKSARNPKRISTSKISRIPCGSSKSQATKRHQGSSGTMYIQQTRGHTAVLVRRRGGVPALGYPLSGSKIPFLYFLSEHSALTKQAIQHVPGIIQHHHAAQQYRSAFAGGNTTAQEVRRVPVSSPDLDDMYPQSFR